MKKNQPCQQTSITPTQNITPGYVLSSAEKDRLTEYLLLLISIDQKLKTKKSEGANSHVA
jgi:hypothetical protein